SQPVPSNLGHVRATMAAVVRRCRTAAHAAGAPRRTGDDMADTNEHGIPRAVAIAWGMVEVPERGPRRGLRHERIVRAVIEIADADGLAAVTVQRVARALEFTTMS